MKGILPALMWIISVCVFSQNITVRGTVVDESGEVLIGVTVQVQGTAIGSITDVDGRFVLPNVPSDGVLEVSYVGMLSQTVALNGRTTIDVILQEDSEILDELIVVGYGVQKKSDITGAMVSIGERELRAMPVQNALQAMQGKAAGVDVTSNERPGELGSIRIRGERSLNATNAPLYVVDGIPLQGAGIENLNPNDIESMDILKDASATAIYGSRGANGVVLITTKRGSKGAFSLNYYSTLSIVNLYDRMEMMNSGEWIDYARQAQMNQGNYPATPTLEADNSLFNKDPYAWAQIEKGWAGGTWDGSKVPTYDWTNTGHQTAISHEHTLSASGGTDRIQAYASFGYLDQEGTQPGQNFQRYTVNTNLDMQTSEWFRLGSTINVTYGDQQYGYAFAGVTGAKDFYSALRGMLPYAVPYTPEGEFIRNPGGDINIVNPIRENDLSHNRRQNLRAFGSFYSEINLGKIWNSLDGLRYRLQFGPDFRYHINGQANPAESVNGDGLNRTRYITDARRSWTLDNLIYYDKIFGKHALGLTLLQSASAYHIEGSDITNNNVNTARELWYNMGSTNNKDHWSLGTSMTKTQLASYMIRANYSFSDKYLLTASGRWDGASQLADGNKWDFFPSLALGWRLEQENFLKDQQWVDQLKLRVGFGVTGNSAIPAYGTKGAVASNNYSFGDQVFTGIVASDLWVPSPVLMANSELGWEKTASYNVGLDFSLIKGRISGSLDVYTSKTSDLLMQQALPSLTGYVRTWANVGKTENKGVDLTLNTVNVKSRDFEWTSSLTFSADRNTITELANGVTEDINNRWFVGQPIGVYYDYVYDGIWKTSEAEEAAKYSRLPGQIRLKDLKNETNEAGEEILSIDANNDRQIVGKSRPDWSGGLVNTFYYKNFELSCFIYGRFGFTMETGGERLNGRFSTRKLDYWIAGVNEDAEYYAPGEEDAYFSSMNYRDGSFIKVRNISLGYNFQPKTLKTIGINNLKLYTQWMNPFQLYSAIDWVDPDTGNSTYNKSVVFGINIGF